MPTGRHFRWNDVTVLTAHLVILVVVTSPGNGEVFTSSDKILGLTNQEGFLLNTLRTYINEQYDNLKELSGFLLSRSKAFHFSSAEERQNLPEHPNGAYFLIKLFVTEWENVLKNNPALSTKMGPLLQSLPQTTDYEGALSAIVRLQRVYKLQVSDIYIGNYLGYMGPALEPLDALEVGRQAFVDGFLEESIQWLELAADKLHSQEEHGSAAHSSPSARSSAAGLLGRAYYFVNRTADAKRKYEESLALDPGQGDVIRLGRELNMSPSPYAYGFANMPWHNNMSDLCLWNKTHRVAELRPYHVCRYKPSLYAPYVRYQEEILSLSPYASVFYNFVSDSESDAFKNFVRGKMARGFVRREKHSAASSARTSDLAWIHDNDMDQAAVISQRIKDVTWLETDRRLPNGPISSEAFQVVNYGLGGHYDPHLDAFDHVPPDPPYLQKSGNRIATFLIYLSDVDRGGNTVFIRSGISVAPQKKMALFWYNFNTEMKRDDLTAHAGCPVLIGHKWIASKWIWTYGNTFRRPCGPHRNTTQLELEPIITSNMCRK